MIEPIAPTVEADRLRRIFQETGTKVGQHLQYNMLLSRFNSQLKSGSHLDAAIAALTEGGEVHQEEPDGPVVRLV